MVDLPEDVSVGFTMTDWKTTHLDTDFYGALAALSVNFPFQIVRGNGKIGFELPTPEVQKTLQGVVQKRAIQISHRGYQGWIEVGTKSDSETYVHFSFPTTHVESYFAEVAQSFLIELGVGLTKGTEADSGSSGVSERLPASVLRAILKKAGRDLSKCQNCGFGAKKEIHHIVPLPRGGTNNPGNLAVLCPNCHALVHASD